MVKRKLTTIFAADVDGYSRLMGEDEHATLERLKEYREAFASFVERHHGRVISWSGDGLLAEFGSVVEAVQCAVEIQRELKARNENIEDKKRMNFRIGINLGDVMVEEHDIFGEGVNIAARLQSLAPAGGILISGPVYEQVKSKLTVGFAFLGERQVKNITGQVSVYGVELVPGGIGVMSAPQAFATEQKPSTAIGDAQPGGIVRRGLAFAIDYLIALAIALPIAIAVENTWDDAIEIDVPFMDIGTDRVIERSEPRVVDKNAAFERAAKKLGITVDIGDEDIAPPEEKNAQHVEIDGIIERDIWGLAKQYYRGINSQTVVPGKKKFDPDSTDFDDLQMVDAKTHQPIDRLQLGWFVLAMMVIYFGATESSSLQGSLGKRMLGLRVKEARDGTPVGFLQAMGRAVVKVLTVVPLFWIAIFNKRRRAVHDIFTDTVVVKER